MLNEWPAFEELLTAQESSYVASPRQTLQKDRANLSKADYERCRRAFALIRAIEMELAKTYQWQHERTDAISARIKEYRRDDH